MQTKQSNQPLISSKSDNKYQIMIILSKRLNNMKSSQKLTIICRKTHNDTQIQQLYKSDRISKLYISKTNKKFVIF